MRIIGGEFRSRRIQSVPGDHVRPTPDRMRESLFSILMPVIEDSIFIDAYAGTGAVGIEAISRGAKRVILIEKDPKAFDVLCANLNMLKTGSRALAIKGKAAQLISRHPGDILFIDPPYPLENEYALCLEQASGHKLVIAQHASKFALRDNYGSLECYRKLRQGDNTLSFFRHTSAASGSLAPEGEADSGGE